MLPGLERLYIGPAKPIQLHSTQFIMAFTEQTEYKIEVIPPHSVLQVRRADIVLKDGVEAGRTYHRHCVVPGADTSNEPAEVQAVAQALHTPECCAAYNTAAQEAAKPLTQLTGGVN